MSEERETQPEEADVDATAAAGSPADAEPGAPVEEAEPTTTEVLAALDRAGELPGDAADAAATSDSGTESGGSDAAPAAAEPEGASGSSESPVELPAAQERPIIAEPEELPSAGPSPAPAEGQVVVSADHPMAALYMQTPMPPDLRGNRGAGIAITLLATVAFAAVYAGALALWRAPFFPPSMFLDQGLLPWVLSWGFLAAAAGFFVAMSLLVLIVGRAGWWAYVLGGFLVAVVVWVASLLGYAYLAHVWGADVTLTPLGLVGDFGLHFPVIAAAIVAREVAVWFGAWIGARGRKVTRKNAEALAEYEESLAETQAKRP